jgi:hypothetical protein
MWPDPIDELRGLIYAPPVLCTLERRRRHISCLKKMNMFGKSRLIYFSNTFSICPTFFSTLPVFFSALPSASKLGLFVTLPAVSLTLPFTS